MGLIQLGNADNLTWCRHPLSFLVEAADDLCNILVDLEDGFRLGRFKFDEVKDLFNVAPVKNALQVKYEQDYWVKDWRYYHANWFSAVAMEKRMMFSILFIIIQ